MGILTGPSAITLGKHLIEVRFGPQKTLEWRRRERMDGWIKVPEADQDLEFKVNAAHRRRKELARLGAIERGFPTYE